MEGPEDRMGHNEAVGARMTPEAAEGSRSSRAGQGRRLPDSEQKPPSSPADSAARSAPPSATPSPAAAWTLRPSLATLAVFLYAAFVFAAGLGALPLLDPDEGRNAEVAREVMRSGTWLVPTYDGLPYLDKPIFFFKTVALSFRLFGVNPAAARLPSVLFGLALLAGLYLFSRRIYGRRTAALAVLAAASSPLVFAFARTVIFDLPLTAFVTGAVLSTFLAEESEGGRRRALHATGAAFAALGTLVKGPVGFLLPLLVVLVFHLRPGRDGADFRGFLRRLFSPLNLLVFFGLTLPWFIGLSAARPDFPRYGLIEETFRRYSTTAFHRTAPFYYYAPVLLAVFFPWSLLLPEAAFVAWKRRHSWTPADRLLIVWAVVVLLFFSSSQSKLPGYILPGVVALAVLTARLGARARSHPEGRAGRIFLHGAVLLTVLSAAAALFLLSHALAWDAMQARFHIGTSEFRRYRPVFLPAGIVFLVAAGLGLAARALRRPVLVFALFALFPVAAVSASWGALREATRAGSSLRLAEAMPPLPRGTTVACLECFAPGLPFYLRHPVTLVTRDGHEITSNYVAFGLRSGRPWPDVLVSRERFAAWSESREGPIYVLAQRSARSRLDSLATARGAAVRALAPGWWGALLPPVPADPTNPTEAEPPASAIPGKG